ncbi:MAG: aminotransferase class IV [Bdellovibrionales bacterium]|nr:aminotransferase class IV [Bdellovibrionales bacterium]
MTTLAWINGKVCDARNAMVSVMDRGFLFGDGVYEAGRSYDRCFLFLEEHWRRLRSSAGKLELPVPWSDQKLTDGLHEAARAYGHANVCFRTVVTRGIIDSVGLHLTDTPEQTLVHLITEVPDKFEAQRKAGVKILTSSVRRNPVLAQDPNIKTSNYLNSLLACQDVKKRGVVDGILCDFRGNVTEGTNFSIFGVTKENVVITPGLEVGILDSITRRHVLSVASTKFAVREAAIPLAEFQNCKEVFIVSSTREIVGVSDWDGKLYSAPGEVTQFLLRLLRDEIRQYVEIHPKF